MSEKTKEMTRAQILREFFFRQGVDTMKSFMEEYKLLTEEDKAELATLAAQELGVLLKAA